MLRRIPVDYMDLQRGFATLFPWHRAVVVPEWPNGEALHPQRVASDSFEVGCTVCFREFAPPGADVLTEELQMAGAGFEVHPCAMIAIEGVP